MISSPLRQLWKEDKTALNLFLTIPSAWTAELMANIGYDALTIDMQHGLADFQMTLSMLQAISTTPTVPLIRLPWNEPSVIMKVLDAGAMGLICPMIETAEDTAGFVRACRYPPQGIRSYGPIRARLYAGDDYYAEANRNILAFAMIETAASVENLAEIAATPGLDGLFVGPFDLSVSLGLPKIADFSDPELLNILRQVQQISKEKRLVPGIFTASVEDAALVAEMGFRLVSNRSDTDMLEEIAREKLMAMKEKIG